MPQFYDCFVSVFESVFVLSDLGEDCTDVKDRAGRVALNYSEIVREGNVDFSCVSQGELLVVLFRKIL